MSSTVREQQQSIWLMFMLRVCDEKKTMRIFCDHAAINACCALRAQLTDRTITLENKKVMPVSPAAGPSLLIQCIAVRSPSQRRCGNETGSYDQRLPPMEPMEQSPFLFLPILCPHPRFSCRALPSFSVNMPGQTRGS